MDLYYTEKGLSFNFRGTLLVPRIEIVTKNSIRHKIAIYIENTETKNEYSLYLDYIENMPLFLKEGLNAPDYFYKKDRRPLSIAKNKIGKNIYYNRETKVIENIL